MPKRKTHEVGIQPGDNASGIDEIAQILARGFLRLAREYAPSGEMGEKLAETALDSTAQGLANPASSRLSVHRGVRPES